MGEQFLAGLLVRLRAGYWRVIYRGLRSRYKLDSEFRFNGVGIQLYGDGSIELGAESYIGELSTIQACAGHRVRVGRRCRISHNVRIYTETSDANCDFSAGGDRLIRASVDIGDGVWIGTNVFIGPGIAIGDNAVIGANAVVTRNVPGGEIWGGVPAQFIRSKHAQDKS